MADDLPGYIKITKAPGIYKTSRSTLLRRRDHARDTNDSVIYTNFILRTRDGQQFREPSRDAIHQLTKEGRVPEWYVSRSWLDSTFGKRVAPPTPATPNSPTDSVALLKQQYEARIGDLKQQLKDVQQQYQQRENKLLDYAQADKQLFAKANENLTQVLALPGITEATKAQQGSTTPQPKSTVIETAAKPQPVEQKAHLELTPTPKQSATKKQGSKSNNTQLDKAATTTTPRWRRFIFGDK